MIYTSTFAGKSRSPVAHSELSEAEVKRRRYAFPEERKFPLTDRQHVLSAIKFFNHVAPKDEKTLADAILKRMEELGMKDVNVGKANRFRKYIEKPEDELSHHGIKGMHWGIRNAETEARYRRDGLDLKRYPKDSTYSGHQALWLRDESAETKKEADRLHASSADLMNRYNDTWKTADGELKRLAKDPQTKKKRRFGYNEKRAKLL